jgi:hypothetical protein
MSEELLVAPYACEGSFALFGDEVLVFEDYNGHKQTFKPDGTKGFFRFELGHAWPKGETVYGTALHPAVTAMSWESILFQNVNYEHRIAEYHKVPGEASKVDDRILGSVLTASYPRPPSGGWKISANSSPGISGVGSFAKLATAMNKVVGEHSAGRHNWTVSMEVIYDFNKAGFLVEGKGLNSGTPDDIAKMGYDYVPVVDANDELLASFSIKKNRLVKKYKNRKTAVLMGGIDSPVHFAGVGIVRYGAEPTAKITRLAASDDSPAVKLLTNLESLSTLLKQASGK